MREELWELLADLWQVCKLLFLCGVIAASCVMVVYTALREWFF